MAAQEAAEASGLMPLDYLLSVMRDEGNDTALRVDAAHKAAPFLHPKLSSVQQAVTFPNGDPLGEFLQDIARNGRRFGQDDA
ncbi:hypothetical protein [Aureimonas psammosilenae]|uniref:hypothetical protein n=1 Tax=Aureimonas psammosilenae TaxID=2495496 RepID=UPI0012613747|nr:hypothetical protein [Aureimonas psammosilenae]